MLDIAKYDTKSGDSIQIEDAKPADIEHIYDTQIATFPDDPAHLSQQDFANMIEDNQSRLLVAKYNSEFAGLFIIRNRKFRPWSGGDNLIVRDKFRRKGIGACLLRAGVKPLNYRPFFRIFVEKNNTNARQMYKKFGFVHVSTKSRFYENNDDAIVMMMSTYKFSR